MKEEFDNQRKNKKRKSRKHSYAYEDETDKRRMKNAYKQTKRESAEDDDWKNWEKFYK
mgnify:FL=1|tara:strand:- start:6299 stop:6472 length:174 start_codon:yes stop_codon:yes gene_type:complete